MSIQTAAKRLPLRAFRPGEYVKRSGTVRRIVSVTPTIRYTSRGESIFHVELACGCTVGAAKGDDFGHRADASEATVCPCGGDAR